MPFNRKKITAKSPVIRTAPLPPKLVVTADELRSAWEQIDAERRLQRIEQIKKILRLGYDRHDEACSRHDDTMSERDAAITVDQLAHHTEMKYRKALTDIVATDDEQAVLGFVDLQNALHGDHADNWVGDEEDEGEDDDWDE